MSDEQKLLFQIDPDRFWEIVQDDNPETRLAELKTPDELLLCEVVRYGVYNQEEMISPPAGFYRGRSCRFPKSNVLLSIGKLPASSNTHR